MIGWSRYVYDFFVIYNAVSDINEKKNDEKIWCKIMFKFIKKGFIVLLVCYCVVSGSFATKCISLNNEPCLVRPILIDLNQNEFHYYLFMVSLNRCNGYCNTLDDPSGRIYVPNKTENMNLDNKNKRKTAKTSHK